MPGGPDSELSVIEGVPEVDVLDVTFVDSVEFESVDVVLRVELLEFERTLWTVFVTLRLVSETLSFSAEYEALLVTVELLGEELVKAV